MSLICAINSNKSPFIFFSAVSYEEALPALRDATRSLRKAQAVGLYMDGLFEEAQVRQTAETRQERLKAGESFSRLAREFSEDERAAPAGGERGWINPARAKETLGLALADVPDRCV